MNPRLLSLSAAALTALLAAGCASLPDGSSMWSASKGIGGSQVTFEGGTTPISAFSDYRNFQIVRRPLYKKHHLPSGVHSAYVGSDSHDANHDVFYVTRKSGVWHLYRYTYGLYDIDLPAELIGTAPVRRIR